MAADEEWFKGGRAGRGRLPFAELQPALNRYAPVRKARDKLSHGQLTWVMDKDGNTDPQAAQLMYKGWKAKMDRDRVTVADLQAMISNAKFCFGSSSISTWGPRRDPKDRCQRKFLAGNKLPNPQSGSARAYGETLTPGARNGIPLSTHC